MVPDTQSDCPIIGRTPDFVAWAIAQPCPLRQFERWDSPQEVERRLRPLRSYCEAEAEGRLFEGICVAPTVSNDTSTWNTAKGFRASEVLAAYGGQDEAQRLCGGCPANALRELLPDPLAGCYGHLEFSGLDDFHQDLESVVGEKDLRDLLAAQFLSTTPIWYGLWICSPASRAQLELLDRLFSGLAARNEAYRPRLAGFLATVATCLKTGLALHLTHVPRGEYTATQWTLLSHCPRCQAQWPLGPRRCAACGFCGHPQPRQRRNVRGERPYWRLAGFLGPANVEPFLRRYFESKQIV